MSAKPNTDQDRAEAEAETRVARDAERSRDLALRQVSLGIAIEKARDVGDAQAVLAYAEAVRRWLADETVQ